MFEESGVYLEDPEKYKDTVVVTDTSAKDLIAKLRAIPKKKELEVAGEFKELPGEVKTGE